MWWFEVLFSQIRKQNVDWPSRSWVNRVRITDLCKILFRKSPLRTAFIFDHWAARGRDRDSPATMRPINRDYLRVMSLAVNPPPKSAISHIVYKISRLWSVCMRRRKSVKSRVIFEAAPLIINSLLLNFLMLDLKHSFLFLIQRSPFVTDGLDFIYRRGDHRKRMDSTKNKIIYGWKNKQWENLVKQSCD